MEVKIKNTLGDYVDVTCQCGNCSMITRKQMDDFKQQSIKYNGKQLPDNMTVICN